MLACSTILASCGKKKDKENSQDENQTTLSQEYDPNKGIDYTSEKKYLVQDGKAYYKIVVPTDADEATEFAATELAGFINKITGVTIEVIEESGYNGGEKVVSVGETELSSHIVADSEELNKDGFIIKTEGEIDSYENLSLYQTGSRYSRS